MTKVAPKNWRTNNAYIYNTIKYFIATLIIKYIRSNEKILNTKCQNQPIIIYN